MYDSRQDLLDALHAAPDILAAVLAGDPAAPVPAAPGGPPAWSVREVVCHLRDATERALERMRLMRDREDPVLEGYDQDAWVQERDYAAADLPAAFATFQQVWAQYLAELEALSPAAWERPGRHAEVGPITISSHALHQVAHLAQHTAQIARLLAAGRANAGRQPL